MAFLDHATFGRPTFSGYAVEPQPRFRRLSVMNGTPRYRLTAPKRTVIVNLGWVFNDQTMGLWRTFWEVTANSGADWITTELMWGTGTDGNEPDANTWKVYDCHMVGPYGAALVGYNWWSISAQLEIRDSIAGPI